MSWRRTVLFPLALSLAASGCFPYRNHDGDYYAGPIDPSNLPAPYQGAGGSSCTGFAPSQQFATCTPATATVQGGALVSYFWFPVSPDVPNPTMLRSVKTNPNGTTTIRDRAPVYVFDNGAEVNDSKSCTPPKDYVYDERRDFVRFDQQGNVFQQKQVASKDPPALPSDPGYQPIYAEVPVASNGEDCNGTHSADGLVDLSNDKKVTLQYDPAPIGNPDFRPVGHGDGKYLAYAIIDPAANVLLPSIDPRCGGKGPCNDVTTGLGAQRFGWFDHFLVAYIDGGYVPTSTQTVPGMAGAADQNLVTADTMTLLAPNAFPVMGASMTCDPRDPLGAGSGQPCIAQGFDLILGAMIAGATKPGVGARGKDGYSPICKVLTFTPPDPANPPKDPTQVNMSSLDPDTNTYVYCLQPQVTK